MPKISRLFSSLLDAIFPVSPEERALLVLDGPEAYQTFPRAPKASIREACSLFRYRNEQVRQLIWCIKFKKSQHAAYLAAYGLSKVLERYVQGTELIILVPMPITRQRRRERGFNQCELILSQLSRIISAAPERFAGIRITNDLLIRIHNVAKQTFKDRAERLESIQNVFAINQKTSGKLEPLKMQVGVDPSTRPKYLILIVDDVITTGSTIRDAVKTLRDAGFGMTFGISVAH